jgi:hypothetical protein
MIMWGQPPSAVHSKRARADSESKKIAARAARGADILVAGITNFR